MKELSPSDASILAARIYDVQNPDVVSIFLRLPFFKKSKPGSNPHVHLNAEVGGRVVLNVQDGFGVCAEGGENNKDELFLIFRGTTTDKHNSDILTDARIGIKNNKNGLPVHVGFDHCFTSMLPKIKEFFKGHNKNSKVVHCIGHSLGGAVASLAADWVARNTIHKPKLYTFGAPRVGTDWFVKSTTSKINSKNMHRVYHRTDPVPMVPLYPFMQAPYNEVGHYMYSSQPLTTGAAHKMDNYIDSVRNKTWEGLNAVPEQPYTIETAVEGWLKSKSPVDASSSAFWRWVDSAMIYVLKKIAMGAILTLQAVFIAGFTLADKIAYILAKGIELMDNISIWVEHLMRKLMQAIGMNVAKSKEELTRDLIRKVLVKITEKANREAQNAIRNM